MTHTQKQWIGFHSDFLRSALEEWETDHTPNAACHVVENVGMLERFSSGALEGFMVILTKPLILAAVQHLGKMEHLAKRMTPDYDTTFDLAMRADALFTAWQVAKHVIAKHDWYDEMRQPLAFARCVLDDVFGLLTDTPHPETGEVRNGGKHYEISMQVIMSQPDCLFYDQAEGLWRALYAERRRRENAKVDQNSP